QCRAAAHATAGETTALYGSYQHESGMCFDLCRIKVTSLLLVPNFISDPDCDGVQGYGVRQNGFWLFVSMINRSQLAAPEAHPSLASGYAIVFYWFRPTRLALSLFGLSQNRVEKLQTCFPMDDDPRGVL